MLLLRREFYERSCPSVFTQVFILHENIHAMRMATFWANPGAGGGGCYNELS